MKKGSRHNDQIGDRGALAVIAEVKAGIVARRRSGGHGANAAARNRPPQRAPPGLDLEFLAQASLTKSPPATCSATPAAVPRRRPDRTWASRPLLRTRRERSGRVATNDPLALEAERAPAIIVLGAARK